ARAVFRRQLGHPSTSGFLSVPATRPRRWRLTASPLTGSLLPLSSSPVPPQSHPASATDTPAPRPEVSARGSWTVQRSPPVCHLCVHFRYGPMTRSPSPRMALSTDFQGSVSFPPGYPSYRTLTFVLVGLTPTEYTSLRWTYDDNSSFLCSWGYSPCALPSGGRTACARWYRCPA